jgi:putative oxidoreductase
MKLINNYGNLVGRFLISVMFLIAGISKITGYASTQGYMEAMGVPGALLPLVIILEVFGALAIIIGYKTKVIAFLLAGFSIVSALLFHNNFADQMQAALFMKNIAIAGGFLFLVVNGAGPLSIDNKINKE